MARRKPASRATRRKHRNNRVRRKVLKSQIQRLSEEIEADMEEIETGKLAGAALESKQAALMSKLDKRERLQEKHDSYPVRRRPLTDGQKKGKSKGRQKGGRNREGLV